MYAQAAGEAIIQLIKWILVGSLCFGAGLWCLAALMDRRISPWEAFAFICVVLGFAGIAISISKTVWFWVFLAAAIVLFFALGRIPGRIAAKREREMRHADLAKYQKGIDFDPTNIAGYVFLADTYMKLGRYNEAIKNYQKALELKPDLIEEKKKLNRALKAKELAESKDMFCPRCQEARPRGLNECLNCGRTFGALETISYNLKGLPAGLTLLVGLGVIGGTGLFLLLFFLGQASLAFLVLLALVGLGAYPLKKLSEYK